MSLTGMKSAHEIEDAAESIDASAASAQHNAEGGKQPAPKRSEPVRLAVFDFDGTSIDGNSPVLLVRYLARKRMLRKRIILRIGSWAAAYKLRLPQNESWVRGLVFTAFAGQPADEVDALLAAFYDERIAPVFRAKADEAMRAHTEAGHVVVVVSATFEPIIVRAMQHHPFAEQVSTRMRVDDDGNYTCDVEGLPVEGEEKLAAVKRFGDERYGEGNWVIDSAYGDHHSDRCVLAAAEHANAVNPDRPLARTARERGWNILAW